MPHDKTFGRKGRLPVPRGNTSGKKDGPSMPRDKSSWKKRSRSSGSDPIIFRDMVDIETLFCTSS